MPWTKLGSFWNVLFARQRRQPEFPTAQYQDIRDRGMAMLDGITDPAQFAKLEHHIRDAFALRARWWYVGPAGEALTNQKTRIQYEHEIEALDRIADLHWVYMFHGDGHIREAAVSRLDGPLPAPVAVYALFWRLNDWAPSVRAVAQQALDRCLPRTDVSVIVPALWVLLATVPSWGRWADQGPVAVQKLLMRGDVAKSLFQDVMTTRRPNLGQTFRALGLNPAIDPLIETAFRNAPLPHVRTMALDALITGKVRWPAHKQRKIWIDRPMGKFKQEPVFCSRDLTVDVDVLGCLRHGAVDRASSVRRRVADAMIALRDDATMGADMDALAQMLGNDPNIGVQTRVAFFQRKRSEA